MRKLVWLVVALILTSCSALPLGDLIPGSSQEPEVVVVCPTCAAPDCPTCPVCPTSLPTEVAATATSVVPTESEATATDDIPTEPAATETKAPTLSPTETVVPTKTSVPTSTPTQTASSTPEPTKTLPPSDMPFQIQPNSPVYLQNFAHADLGCQWMGIAGQVFDATGNPLLNGVVVVEGFLNNKVVDQLTLTGLSTPYGPGGYEIALSDSVIASTNSLFITLYDLTGKALSLPVIIDTFEDCNKNLIVVNFQKVN